VTVMKLQVPQNAGYLLTRSLTLNIGTIGCPETSVTTNVRRAASHKGKSLVYIAAEATTVIFLKCSCTNEGHLNFLQIIRNMEAAGLSEKLVVTCQIARYCNLEQ
jgi:hypothetical protein